VVIRCRDGWCPSGDTEDGDQGFEKLEGLFPGLDIVYVGVSHRNGEAADGGRGIIGSIVAIACQQGAAIGFWAEINIMFVEVAEKDTLIAIVLEAGFHSESP